jgi:hypothetical protein
VTTTASSPPAPFRLGSWVKLMTVGWLLGFVFVLALAMLWGLTGHESQWMVGVGMAAGVALLQSRFLDAAMERRRWVIASMVAMGVPFVLWDVSRVIQVPLVPGLPGAAAIGSILLGVVQGRMLWHAARPIAWWALANLLGWGIPVGIIGLADAPVLGGWGPALSTLAMFLGGTVLGLSTGTALRWLPLETAIPRGEEPF